VSDVNDFQPPYDILSIEFDPTDRMVSITIIDPAKSSREYGVMPEVRQLRIDGLKWEQHVEEILVDVTDLVIAVERSGTPMTRPSRGRDVAAD
jgi:hypothetical protein